LQAVMLRGDDDALGQIIIHTMYGI
jgi:hypothetical protein